MAMGDFHLCQSHVLPTVWCTKCFWNLGVPALQAAQVPGSLPNPWSMDRSNQYSKLVTYRDHMWKTY